MKTVTTFEPGDLVYLKSGGPRMTVAWVDEHGQARCEWFSSNTHERKSELFVIGSLASASNEYLAMASSILSYSGGSPRDADDDDTKPRKSWLRWP